MRKQDYLLELIKSLNPSEKRYFKQYANLQPGQKNYMKLYEILEKETSYDAAMISAKLKTTPKKLADDKEYLQQVLLRALRNFEQDVNPVTSLTHRYLEAEMLKRRGMAGYALSQLDKMYEKAVLHELHGVLLDSFLLRQTVVLYKPDNSPEFISEELFRHQLMQLSEQMESKLVYAQLAPYFVNASDPKGLKEIEKTPFMQKNPETLLSIQARIRWYHMKSIIATLTDDKTSSVMCAGKIIDVFEKNPAIKQVLPDIYILSIMDLADRLPAEEMEQALKLIDKAISVMDKNDLAVNQRIISKFKFQAQSQKIIILHNLFRYNDSIEIAKKVLAVHPFPTHNFLRPALLFIYSACLLYTGQADKAVEPLREILIGNKNERPDILQNAMLLELMVQYDLKNYSLIPYQVSSVRKWIKRKSMPAENSSLYLKWMLRIAAAAETGNPKPELKSFSEEINTGKIKIEPVELNISYWLQSKIKSTK